MTPSIVARARTGATWRSSEAFAPGGDDREHPAPGPKGGRPSERFRLVTSVTVTETPREASINGGFGSGDTGDNADEWGEL